MGAQVGRQWSEEGFIDPDAFGALPAGGKADPQRPQVRAEFGFWGFKVLGF
jgi:hypothetical protein